MSESRYNQPQARAVKRIIARFGGATRVSEILDIHRTNVSKWKVVIPGDHALKLYKYAQEQGWNIPLAEFRPDIFKEGYRANFQPYA